MGSSFSRNRNAQIEDVGQYSNSNAYLYPPRNGLYFASHFIMGGEKFQTPQPESYLFGENMDLNYLGSKPTPFPYCAPLPNEPTRTLRALINIHKESLKLVRMFPTEIDSIHVTGDKQNYHLFYNIEFIFDCDVKSSIAIYYMCTEEVFSTGVVYTSKDPSHNSDMYHYQKGINQHFTQPCHIFCPNIYDENDLLYRAFDSQGNFDPSVKFPIVIQCTAEEGDEPRQSQSLIAIVEKNHDNTFAIKPFKQKIFIDGVSYLMQEIYGIENKSVTMSEATVYPCPDDEIEDNGSECVICMSDSRDTLILPCKHLCLCYACADSLRYQANNCPICRAPFRALLQIKAVRKCINPSRLSCTPSALLHGSADDLCDIPSGYEPIPLIEALNGSIAPPSSTHGMFSFRNSSRRSSCGSPIVKCKSDKIKKDKFKENQKEKWTAKCVSDKSESSSTGRSAQEQSRLLEGKDEREMDTLQRGSYPMLSLGDGLDEVRYMAETDLVSVTGGSAPDMLITQRMERGDEIGEITKEFVESVKLAESEPTDDLDISED